MSLLSTDVSTAQYVITVNDSQFSGLWRICFFVYGKSVARGAFPPFFDLMAPKIRYQ